MSDQFGQGMAVDHFHPFIYTEENCTSQLSAGRWVTWPDWQWFPHSCVLHDYVSRYIRAAGYS